MLGGEFPGLIAHSIHEQVWRARIGGHITAFTKELIPLSNRPVFRDEDRIDEWGPCVTEITDMDLEKCLETEERESRYVDRKSDV